MRILFLCGSLEAGKDGVGDYTILLCSQLAARGHQTLAFAWADDYVDEFSETTRSANQQDIRCLHLSRKTDWKERERRLEAVVDEFSPDCISLQYVPWTYGRYGASCAPAFLLNKLIPKNVTCQIMLHELWVGASSADTWKERLIGVFQKRSIRKLIHLSRPRSIHCSNPNYVNRLRSAGFECKLLPLFGNIPIGQADHKAEIFDLLKEKSSGRFDCTIREDYLLSAVFGTIHPQWFPGPAIESCVQHLQAEGKGRRLGLVLVGRNGKYADHLKDELHSRYGENVLIIQAGELEHNLLSGLFLEFDFGWSTTPHGLTGKSGSALAMLEHGLPVLVTRNDIRAVEAPMPDHYIAQKATLFHETNFDWSAFLTKKSEPKAVLSDVAEQFLADLVDESV